MRPGDKAIPGRHPAAVYPIVLSAAPLFSIMLFIPGLFGYSYFVLPPAWGREALDVDSDGLDVVVVMMGGGALIGTLSLAALGRMRRRGLFLLGSALAWGIALAVFS